MRNLGRNVGWKVTDELVYFVSSKVTEAGKYNRSDGWSIIQYIHCTLYSSISKAKRKFEFFEL